ncbi:MAG: hypothetical protein DMG69_16300 [Acidobacteria bacterium]|nr:MAG: hypothetical protein DMG69_16300 [Acidobacteriota bacterium]
MLLFWAKCQDAGAWFSKTRTHASIAGVLLVLCFGPGQCSSESFAQPSFAPPLDKVTELGLKYRVIAALGDRLPCEPQLSTLVERARKEFPEIKKDRVAFHVILEHLGLKKAVKFSDDEKLLVYRDYRELNAIHFAPSGDKYRVTFGPPLECRQYASPREVFIDRQGRVGGGTESVHHDVSPPLRELGDREQPQSAPTPIAKVSLPYLRYRLLSHFGQAGVCGPPVIGADEKLRQIRAFAEIEQDSATLNAVLSHLGLEGRQELSDEQKLAVFQEYETLRAIDLELLASKYAFSMNVLMPERSGTSFGKSGDRVHGLVDRQGRISVLRRNPIVLACPK